MDWGPVIARPADDDSTTSGATPVDESSTVQSTTPGRTRLQRLAHELKTPLSAIVSAAEIMRDERLGPLGNPRYRDYSEDIHRTARHALDVINDMLSGRTGESERPSRPAVRAVTEIDVCEFVMRVASSLRPLAERSGLVLETQCEPRLPRLVAEATHVRQILINLFTNSARHTPAGGMIRFGARFDRTAGLVLEVTDTGTGMTPEAIDAAMADDATDPAVRFVENDETETMAAPAGVAETGFWGGNGLGIGLKLVRGMTAANGGRIAITSPPPGQRSGTQVSVSFGMDRLVFV